MTGRRALAIALVTALSITVTACSDDDAPKVETSDVLEPLAGAIVGSYDRLTTAFEALGGDLGELCGAPGPATLDAARSRWREVSLAWRATRAVGVGPAMERRLAAAIGFLARPASIEELLTSTDPVDVAGLQSAGAAVKGISALEIGLFGDGADTLATPAGQRRCEYVASAAALASEASAAVHADWTGGYQDTFVAGMDGDPQSSLDAIVNEAIFRVTEVDDQGLRALVEATEPGELPANRADGPAAFHLAELEAMLDGVIGVIESDGEPSLADLVRAHSADTADRLDRAVQAADEAVGRLPESVTAAFTSPEVIAEAQEAVMALKVLLATEVASELGVTISFSDADGDS